MTIDISFDLETWGTDPGDDIRSIGACVIDMSPEAPYIDAQRTFYRACSNDSVYISGDPDNPASYQRKYPLGRDPRTEKWWSEQSSEALRAFENPIDIKQAILDFTSWIQVMTGQETPWKDPSAMRLWSHGPSFDPPILAMVCKILQVQVPWHYRAPRDTRTRFDDAGIFDHTAWLRMHPGPLGILHHALDDAISQARAIHEAGMRIFNLQ